jgi:hypothetical protein
VADVVSGELGTHRRELEEWNWSAELIFWWIIRLLAWFWRWWWPISVELVRDSGSGAVIGDGEEGLLEVR